MIINHNMNAMNAHRNMAMNGVNSGKSMEKLSSGLRINRAGDDAAGLAISEKMRGQIRGLDQATRNSQDGISMVQTAEGALNETHSILQRMRELATQAANDTNNTGDRGQVQNEINQLTSEINRIGNTTEFNTQKVLDGGAAAKAATAAATPAAKLAPAVAGKFEFKLGTMANADKITIDGKDFEKAAADDAATGKFKDAAGLKAAIEANTDLSAKYDVTEATGTFTLTQKAGTESATGAAITSTIVIGADKTAFDDSVKTTTAGVPAEVAKVAVDPTAAVEAVEAKEATAATVTGTKLATADLTGEKLLTLKVNSKDVTLTEVGTLAATDGTDATKVAEALNKDLKTAGLDADVKAVVNKDGGIDIQSVKTGVAGSVKIEAGTGDMTKLGLKAADVKGTDAVEAVEAKAAQASSFTATLQIGANEGQAFKIAIKDMRSEALGISKKLEAPKLDADGKAVVTVDPTAAVEAVEAKEAAAATVTGTKLATADLTGEKLLTLKVNSKDVTLTEVGTLAATDGTDATKVAEALNKDLKTAGLDTDVKAVVNKDGGIDLQSVKTGVAGSVKLEAGTGDMTKLGLKAADVKGTDAVEAKAAKAATVSPFSKEAKVTNGTTDTEVEVSLDMSSHASATAAIKTLDEAINKVSTERATLGSFQNRLEHTIANLGTSSENLTAAESRIRDVDMAKEMMNFSKNNILSQAAQAMLAQANQQPQGVLQLLR